MNLIETTALGCKAAPKKLSGELWSLASGKSLGACWRGGVLIGLAGGNMNLAVEQNFGPQARRYMDETEFPWLHTTRPDLTCPVCGATDIYGNGMWFIGCLLDVGIHLNNKHDEITREWISDYLSKWDPDRLSKPEQKSEPVSQT